ncbi:MAG: hypothetical protein PHO30_04125 [Candidatus Omnitrophica bacterium]|jgi:hypothetical protein|nr:hypothetical protein [Candidatus Omnitrophota bacterium]
MPYDASLDNNLFSKSWETELDRLTVSVYSYNNGPKKLQISRNSRDSQGEMKFAKLGRMTKEEVEVVLPMIQEAIKHM